MNVDKLARHYKFLTPWERLSLIVDAIIRKDELELRRLESSAPHYRIDVANHTGLKIGLHCVAITYLLQQLDTAMLANHIDILTIEDYQFNLKRRRVQKDLDRVAKVLAFRTVLQADAWRLFCSDLHVDAELILSDLPGYQAVCDFEKSARHWACTAKEANAYLRRSAARDEKKQNDALKALPADAVFPTAEEWAGRMRAELERHLKMWM
jgi:hypothetical protein